MNVSCMVEEGKRKETDEKRKGKMERQARGGKEGGRDGGARER